MDGNNDFDLIMRSITSGFTGDPTLDIQYLQKKCEEYKEHEMAQEILRACGRLMYEMMPEDKKAELERAIDNDSSATEAILDEVRFNIYKKNYDKAITIMEDLVKRVEDLDMFQDDQVSEYHIFNEFFEEILYRHLYSPTKDLRQAQIPYTNIYALYGILLVELRRLEDAREALKKGLQWNPVHFEIMSEYVETFKIEGNMEEFYEKTIKLFQIAIHAPEVARCFRNLGYYFVEKELYHEAAAAYLLSTKYDNESKQAQSELYYINKMTGGIKDPTFEEIVGYAEKYGFPTGADGAILYIAYTYGKHFLEQGEKEAARYFLGILYELTQDEQVKEMLPPDYSPEDKAKKAIPGRYVSV